jgi:hypothetical protein
MREDTVWHAAQGRLSFHTIWIVLACDEELRKYYTALYKASTGIALAPPKFGSHVSVVRGDEEHIKPGLWQRNLQGPTVLYEYEDEIREEDKYVWIDVRSKDLECLREGLGLSGTPPFSFHLTLGRKEK